MKISTERLKQIIKEELQQTNEVSDPMDPVMRRLIVFKRKLESTKQYELSDEMSEIIDDLNQAIGRLKVLNK
tara:strand:- start:679 stop:894 length:216 start_codon:yes stop_codon:yes gene_type:complete